MSEEQSTDLVAVPPKEWDGVDRRARAAHGGLRARIARILRARRVTDDKRGSVLILTAISLAMLVAAAAFALDLSNVYLAKSTVQRIADQSAMAAAFAYAQAGDTTSNYVNATDAASGLATTNGGGSATVSTSIVASPSGDGNSAVQVTVTSPVTLSSLASAIKVGLTSATVSATAWAEIQSTVPCIITTGYDGSGGGIFTSGGPSITATNCAVESNAQQLYALGNSGGTFAAQQFTSTGSITNSGYATITGTEHPNWTAATDPYVGTTAFARADNLSSYLTTPTFPTVGTAPTGGTAETCNTTLSNLPAGGSYALTINSGCTAISFTAGTASSVTNISGISISNATVAITLGYGTYNINGIGWGTSSGTLTIYAPDNPTINVWGGIIVKGNMIVYGPATYNVQGSIYNQGAGTMVFCNSQVNDSTCAVNGSSTSTFNVKGGIISNSYQYSKFPNGTYNIVTADSTAGSGAGIASLASSTLTFGDGTFNVVGGLYLGGSANLTFGKTAAGCPTFQIPSAATSGSASGNAITTAGGSSLTFVCGGGNIDINGNVSTIGGVQFNSTNVAAGGSDININGGVWIGGSAPTSCGSGNGNWNAYYSRVLDTGTGGVCIGAGYTLTLTPPTSITSATLGTASTLAFASDTTTTSAITDGAAITVAGAFYMPNAIMYLIGGGAISGNGGCMFFGVGTISLQAGTSISTNCSGIDSASSASASLVK